MRTLQIRCPMCLHRLDKCRCSSKAWEREEGPQEPIDNQED